MLGDSFISGITLLGLPTEVYSFGIQYLYVIGGVFLMGYVMSTFYLPVFHDLNITSTYEVNSKLRRGTAGRQSKLIPTDFRLVFGSKIQPKTSNVWCDYVHYYECKLMTLFN